MLSEACRVLGLVLACELQVWACYGCSSRQEPDMNCNHVSSMLAVHDQLGTETAAVDANRGRGRSAEDPDRASRRHRRSTVAVAVPCLGTSTGSDAALRPPVRATGRTPDVAWQQCKIDLAWEGSASLPLSFSLR